jgi:hypothetical protein
VAVFVEASWVEIRVRVAVFVEANSVETIVVGAV